MSRLLFVLVLIALAALGRLIPHPPNFTPVAAMALFAGATLDRRLWAVLVPVGAMLLSDLYLGMDPSFFFVYLPLALTALIGTRLASNRKPMRLAGGSIAASVLFFVISNFGVWVGGALYAKNFEGLIQCYVAAIPFFGNTVAGDLFYAGVMFGLLALAEKWVPELRSRALMAPQ